MITKQIVFFSLIAIAIGLILWRMGRRIVAKGKLTEAMIIKNVHCSNELTKIQNFYGINDDESGTYYPVIQFLTGKNELITKQLTIGFNPPKSVGKKISVIYHPRDPTNILIYPRIQLEVIPKLLVSVGLIGLIVVVLDVF